MRIVALASIWLLISILTIRSQEAQEAKEAQISKIQYCESYSLWNVIPEAALAKEGLLEKLQKLRQIIASVRTHDVAKRKIRVTVTDCPAYGHRVRSSAQITIATLFQESGYALFPIDYDVFITLAELRAASEDDIVQIGREQSCLIHAGVADDRFRLHDIQTHAVIQCRHDTAQAMGDTEEARWYSRLLESPQANLASSERHPAERKAFKKIQK